MQIAYSVSGSGVTTTDGTTAGVVGGLGTATNGVNAFTTITASQSTAGENFQFTQSYLEGDASSNFSSCNRRSGEFFRPYISTAAGAIGSGAATIDNHVISVTGGDPGSSITGQYVTTLSVD